MPPGPNWVLPDCPYFRLSEFQYVCHRRSPHRGQIYLPSASALKNLQRLVQLVLCPLRAHFGLPVYILSGGGYDPLRDPETGLWVSHRRSKITQHRVGHAADFRVGARRASEAWPLARTVNWILGRLQKLEIPGGVGVYAAERNCFLHVDLRSKRGRWHDAEGST